MNKEEKWIEDVRNRMKDYSEPLPQTVWKRLEQELDTPKVIPMWRRWQAVAAIMLLVVASSLTVWFWTSPAADYVNERSAMLQTIPSDDMYVADESDSPKVNEPEKKVEQYPMQQMAMSAAAVVPTMVTANLYPMTEMQEQTVSQEDYIASEKEEEKKEQEESAEVKQRKLRSRRMADYEQMERNRASIEAEKRRKKKNNWSMSVGAGNTPYTSSNTFGGLGQLSARSVYMKNDIGIAPMSEAATAYSQVLFNNRDQQSETKIKHHMPVSVGASVKWNLNKAWALETGLVYTMLSSELHFGKYSYLEEEQKLHYIGIPLKVHRSIWGNNRFLFYASAGGMVEKCVSGKMEKVYVTGNSERETKQNSLDIDPLQWSVSAAMGAQINLIHCLGLYIEPGVSYYFDDHSDVETIRKDHPLNFNLQLGLRFNFSK